MSEVDASQSVFASGRVTPTVAPFQSHRLVNDGNSVWELETVPESP